MTYLPPFRLFICVWFVRAWFVCLQVCADYDLITKLVMISNRLLVLATTLQHIRTVSLSMVLCKNRIRVLLYIVCLCIKFYSKIVGSLFEACIVKLSVRHNHSKTGTSKMETPSIEKSQHKYSPKPIWPQNV